MPTLKAHWLHFAGFVADLTSGELFKDGAKVQLQDKPYQILALLLQRPKEVISRQEIISKVWPDTFVEEDLCLNVAIRRLRSALNDNASNAKFVETVGSHGYRFIAEVMNSDIPEMVEQGRGRPRIAVFPFETTNGLPYSSFASAMTELMTVELRRMRPALSVVTPEFTTERARKGKGKLAICRSVAADYMLVGTLSESAGQTQIIVRLLKCRTQSCVWGESYIHAREDLFTSQISISRKVAAMVNQSIPVSVRHMHQDVVPASAYEKYLQGCSFRSRLSEGALDRSILLLEAAVGECPRFAHACARLLLMLTAW